MSALFAVSVLILLQAYVGYPLSLMLLGAIRGRRSGVPAGGEAPTVTLVISAYNEERWIRAKLDNTLALDYPRERLRVVVVSDGSTDGTEAITLEYAGRGIELAAFPGRSGKVACLNRVIPHLGSDLVVMSDANSMYRPDALRRLVRHFKEPDIGCVCGRLVYVNPRHEAAGDGEEVYWGYEGLIKRLESALGSLLGANGSIYAYRRQLFRPVDPLMFCDDVIPIRVAIAGRRVIYDPEAACTEETAEEAVEVRRRRRHASFGMRSMLRVMAEAAAAGRWLIVYQCLSHRVLRWAGGLALLTIAAATPSLPSPARQVMVGTQALFYGAAVAGGVLAQLGVRLRFAYLAYYIVVIHLAGLAGLVRLILGLDRPWWEPRK